MHAEAPGAAHFIPGGFGLIDAPDFAKGASLVAMGTPFMLLAAALAQGVGLAWMARVGEESGPVIAEHHSEVH
jgi:hypothetical protein